MAQYCYKWTKVLDSRSRPIRGLLERNGRYYAQMRYPGERSPRKVPLMDDQGQPVRTPPQAVAALAVLKVARSRGKRPTTHSPAFDEYADHYLEYARLTGTKVPGTLAREKCSLGHLKKFFGCVRLSTITAANIAEYVQDRKLQGDSNNNINSQMVALGNLLKFARDVEQKLVVDELPRRVWLKYNAPKRTLQPEAGIDAFCAEAARCQMDPKVALILRIQAEYPSKRNGADWHKAFAQHPEWKKELHADTATGRDTLYHQALRLRARASGRQPEPACLRTRALSPEPKPVYEQGQMLADWIRLMQYSGARYTAALTAKWEQVNWERRQMTLITKRGKRVNLGFNPSLEAHLKDIWSRRVPLENGQFSAYLFPSTRGTGDRPVRSFRRSYDAVRAKTGVRLKPHDLRHWFISMCVMEGFDFMTIAEWAGHSDGGILIAKTYGHLRPGHADEQAARLTLTGKTNGKANPPPPPLPADLTKISVADLLKAAEALKQLQTAAPAPAAAEH
jgi:integrase